MAFGWKKFVDTEMVEIFLEKLGLG